MESSDLPAPAPWFDGRYGHDVDIDGEWAIIGAYGDGRLAYESGSVTFWHHEDGEWVENATFWSPNPSSRGRLGAAVAISGSHAVAGAIGEDRAYVFALTDAGWSIEDVLAPSDVSRFGISVAMSESRIVVGDDLGHGSGAAHVYSRQNDSWQRTDVLMPNGVSGRAQFGYDVATYEDRVAVGMTTFDSTGGRQGRAFVYNSTADGYQLEYVAKPGYSGPASFGYSLVLGQGLLVVGAPRFDGSAGTDSGAVHVFEFDAGSWNESQVLTPAAHGDQGYYGVRVDVGEWNLEDETASVGPEAADGRVRASVVIAREGESARAIVVGAMGYESAQVFIQRNSTWQQAAEFGPSHDAQSGFGSGVALDGHLLVGAELDSRNVSLAGHVYAFAMADAPLLESNFAVRLDP